MAKTRHQQPEPTSSKGTMAILVLGGMLVGALVVWALTRTVEPESVMTSVSTAPAPAAAGSTQPTSPITATSTSAPSAVATAQTPPPGSQGDPSSVQRIAVEDLRAKLNRNDVTVLDVREAVAFQAGHIPGAINVPMASIETNLDTIPKDKLIVTYCTWPAEESSARAALIMREKGVTNVQALYGGYNAWTGQGYPTER